MLQVGEIKQGLQRLKALDPQFRLFGANAHRYQPGPPLGETVVAEFEGKHGIHLPAGYRQFFLEVGNGGAGPAYGLFPLGEHADNWGFCSFDKGCLVGTLADEFKHLNAWNASDELWSREPDLESLVESEQDQAMEAWDELLESEYWSGPIMDGAIPICHLGCARRQWLVVTGPERGNVWGDDRVDQTGVYPLQIAGTLRVSFQLWYMSWLSDSIALAEKKQ